MPSPKTVFIVGSVILTVSATAAMRLAPPMSGTKSVPMIPARLLRCTLGHAFNLDPHIEQKMSDVKYEGRYEITLYLPKTPVRQGPPPDATEAPEPVNPETRIVSDPSNLLRDVPPGFTRVIDQWPDRVEMTRVIQAPLSNLIIVNQIDSTQHVANFFMTKATDVATLDLKHVYQGPCRFTEGATASYR